MDMSAAESAPPDSFSEDASEDSESQAALGAANGHQPRVMMVRRTNSAQQSVTLVDRQFDVEAFVPHHVAAFLQQTRGYTSLGRLRGSVVRLDKYHFATLTRCLASDERPDVASKASVSAPSMNRDRPRVYLWVDALSIIDDNELAVNPLPEVASHPLVADRLRALSDTELEMQLSVHQGLPPMPVDKKGAPERFDDGRPLLEEDCVIPEDQERALDAQDDWGVPQSAEKQPTDSELIEQNGSVPMPESQGVRVEASEAQAQSQSMQRASVGSETLGEVQLLNSSSQPNSEAYPFQQEDIRETFVAGSGSSETEDEDEVEEPAADVSRSPLAQITIEQAHPGGESTAAVPSPTHQPYQALMRKENVVNDVEQSEGGESNPDPSPRTPIGLSQSSLTETQLPVGGTWSEPNGIVGYVRKFFGLGSSSGEHQSDTHPPEPMEEDRDPSDEQVDEDHDLPGEFADTQPPEPVGEKLHPSDEFPSSQATVVLQYSLGDDDVNAFEYEGMSTSSDDMEEDDVADVDHSAIEESLNDAQPEIAFTPEKDAPLPRERRAASVTPGFKTPSPSALSVTPGTEKKTQAAARQASAASPSSPTETHRSKRSSRQAHSLAHSTDHISPTGPSSKLSPIKSPSKMTPFDLEAKKNLQRIAEESADTQHGRSKRPRRTESVENPQSPPAAQPQPVRQEAADARSSSRPAQNPSDDDPRASKRRRHEISAKNASRTATPPSAALQSQRPVSAFSTRRGAQPDGGAAVLDKYSLEAVCRSLGPQAEARITPEPRARQSRRAWQRYEHMFPPLDMDRLKRILAEKKG
ncbi:hypothetical protein BBJ28_00017062 [Nothophytophthora sp. Chile5]|nr:hypothetical protein BBJ28_00017062 [Nothophytophthora sp. Chile5]